MAGLKECGQAVGAQLITQLGDFAPPTILQQAARLQARQRWFNLVVTNVPGPQAPLYAAGARMVASYPVPPLVPDHPVAIGVTSYDGAVFYGITADRDAVPDAELLGTCIREALDELLELSSSSRRRAPRGRRTHRPEDPS